MHKKDKTVEWEEEKDLQIPEGDQPFRACRVICNLQMNDVEMMGALISQIQCLINFISFLHIIDICVILHQTIASTCPVTAGCPLLYITHSTRPPLDCPNAFATPPHLFILQASIIDALSQSSTCFNP